MSGKINTYIGTYTFIYTKYVTTQTFTNAQFVNSYVLRFYFAYFSALFTNVINATILSSLNPDYTVYT